MMLGGAIPGAQILIVEYEPVPRGIAFSLTLAGLALVARRRVLEGTLLGMSGILASSDNYFAVLDWLADGPAAQQEGVFIQPASRRCRIARRGNFAS